VIEHRSTPHPVSPLARIFVSLGVALALTVVLALAGAAVATVLAPDADRAADVAWSPSPANGLSH
jgi:hypothetical protein